jgi:nucleoside-diphosphate-sugar epimerase
MNILITGANGFLGSNVAKQLHKEGYQLYLVSKNTTNIEQLISSHLYSSAHTHELSQYVEKVREFSPDVVLHFGWSGGNSYADVDSTGQLIDNVQPGIEFIKLLSTLDKKPKFIGLGSFAEYGDQKTPSDENTKEAPINLYGLSKYTFKNYSKMLCEKYNIDWVWVRPCYIYGPHDVKTRLVPTLIHKLTNNQIVKLDECTAIVDYLYIDDFVQLLNVLIKEEKEGIYNICSGNQYSIKEIVATLRILTESTSEIVYDTSLTRKNSPKYTCGVNRKILSLKNITKTSLHNGLLKTVEYEKSCSNKR